MRVCMCVRLRVSGLTHMTSYVCRKTLAVLACSALKRTYRDILRSELSKAAAIPNCHDQPEVAFVSMIQGLAGSIDYSNCHDQPEVAFVILSQGFMQFTDCSKS